MNEHVLRDKGRYVGGREVATRLLSGLLYNCIPGVKPV